MGLCQYIFYDIFFPYLQAEIVEMILVVSRFRFLRVGSQISVLRVLILLGMQFLKVGSRISDWSQFCFSFLTIIVGYQPEKIQRGRYKPKLNENDQYAVCHAMSGKQKLFPLSLLAGILIYSTLHLDVYRCPLKFFIPFYSASPDFIEVKNPHRQTDRVTNSLAPNTWVCFFSVKFATALFVLLARNNLLNKTNFSIVKKFENKLIHTSFQFLEFWNCLQRNVIEKFV